MKNLQKGTTVTNFIIVIIFLIVIVAVYYYEQNPNIKPDGHLLPDNNLPKENLTPVENNTSSNQSEVLGKPANFDGHYVVTEIGCGTACFNYSVVDKQTGKVYTLQTIYDRGEYTGDIGKPYSLNSNQIKIVTENGSKINTYTFDGKNFNLVSSVKTGLPSGK